MPIGDYSEDWHRYKLLRNVFLVLWLGLIPALYVFFVVGSRIVQTDILAIVLTGSWVLAGVWVRIVLLTWQCPRCGERFSGASLWVADWSYGKYFLPKRCVHCALPKYAKDASAGTER
jgi:hypothetical protein